MKVERSSLDQVKARMAAIKKKQEEKERVEEFGKHAGPFSVWSLV